jgi:hypothetical protein
VVIWKKMLFDDVRLGLILIELLIRAKKGTTRTHIYIE